MVQFYIYLHCKPDGTPFYVGKGTKKRAHNMANRTEWHKRLVAKHGVKIVLFPMASEQVAFDNEIVWIAALRSSGFELCNLTDGGEGPSGNKKSPEVVEKTARAHRGMKRSEETKRKISEAKKGKPKAPISEETKAKISAAMRGKRNALGHKFTAESKAKCSLAQIGNKKGAAKK